MELRVPMKSVSVFTPERSVPGRSDFGDTQAATVGPVTEEGTMAPAVVVRA
jgi:hypothetical protein